MNTSNDILDVMCGGEEEYSNSSRNPLMISSLAEHSYCASIMSTSAVSSEEPVIADLFGADSELQTQLCNNRIPIGIGDVNLDGFNFSVPSMCENDEDDSIGLENIWSGLSNDTSSTGIVEIAASIDEDQQQQQQRVVKTECEKPSQDIHTEGEDKIHQGQETPVKVAYSRPRRTDFIENPHKRRDHFKFYYGRLICDFHRIKSRTGCDGTMLAFFEGKPYDSTYTVAEDLSESECLGRFSAAYSSAYSKGSTINKSLLHGGMDDHQYAATMLTQNVASPDIRDHQYVEKPVTSVIDSDITDGDEEPADNLIKASVNPNGNGKQWKRYRCDYIRVRWERTQSFYKVVKTLFSNKILLQQRTGADVHLFVEYEGVLINDKNYKDVTNLICARREKIYSRTHILKPKVLPVVTPLLPQHTPTTAVPLTFILPNLTSFPLHMPFLVPGSKTPGTVSSDSSHSLQATGTEFRMEEKLDPVLSQESTVAKSQSIVTFVQKDGPENHVSISFDHIPPAADNDNLFLDESNMSTCDETTDPLDVTGQQLLTFAPRNSSAPSSPEISIARGMKESSTNTEPICSICSGTEGSTTYQGSDEQNTQKSFWIRCNDAFCYNMVHAGCIGFHVTHTVHLKQLPAFYCKSHR